MNTRQLNTIFFRPFAFLLILVITLAGVRPVSAGNSSPFVGSWQAIDLDGSEMHLTIGGPPGGPFQITWGDKYISFCDGGAGLIRGTGSLDPGDPYLLEADLHLECFTSGATLDLHLPLRYHPASDMLTMHYEDGRVTIWQHAGQAPSAPFMGLRVNYGHDWVESFYEAGHTVWLTVTGADGAVKASAVVFTELKDFWGGETGFQSEPADWVPAQPDIQPYDWVYAWGDNGASSQVQIGEINGTVDLLGDSIAGTVTAPWFSSPVEIGCHPWGSPLPVEMPIVWVMPDGTEQYSCSWAGTWNILPYQDVGIGYVGEDGHWVANAIYASAPMIVASESGNWFWTSGISQGMLELSIYDSELDGEGVNLLWSGSQLSDDGGFTIVGQDTHGIDLVEGNYIVVSDGVYPKGLVILPTTVTVFDTTNEVMAGVAPAGSLVWAAAGPMEWQQRMVVQADPVSGEWLADFASIGFDITEDMRPWSFSQIFDGDGDANEGSTPPLPKIFAHPAYDFVEGVEWTPGSDVTLSIDNPANGVGVDYTDTQMAGGDSWVRFPLVEFDLQAGHEITLVNSNNTVTMIVSSLQVTRFNLDAQTVSGVGDPGSEVRFIDNGLVVPVDESGNWSASFPELLPNTWWTVTQDLSNGNQVIETFRVPNPQISAHPAYNFIEGHEWTPGGLVTITIDDPVNGEGVDYTQIEVASDNINYLYDTRVGFALSFDLQEGHIVTMTDGQYSQTMIVSSLRVTGFNLGTQTVYGVGDPGSEIQVANNNALTPVDGDGNWSATIEGLLPGTWWGVVHTYVDGNQTMETFRAPAPNFYVVPDEERIFAAEWSPGETVTVMVNGAVVTSQVASSDGSPYGPEVMFDLSLLMVDLQVNDTITLTDGRSTKELVIPVLAVQGYDAASQTLYGIAAPGDLFVGVEGTDLWITVGEDGTWSVSSPEYGPGEWGSAIIWDGDGDQTRDIFMIPFP